MQTLEGGKNLRKNMIEKYGSEEAWKKVMGERGKVGGKNGTKEKGSIKGFAANIERARTAGALGGRRSRRGKATA